MPSVRPSNSGSTWIVRRALRKLPLEHLLRYLRALPSIRVHPELDGRTLDIVHSLRWLPRVITKHTLPIERELG